MIIVIDSNVIFSALIRDSTTRKLILEYRGTFLLPAFIMEEMEKHIDLLLAKSGMDHDGFNALVRLLFRKMLIIPDEILQPYHEQAFAIVADIDINDVIFISCALAYPGSVLW